MTIRKATLGGSSSAGSTPANAELTIDTRAVGGPSRRRSWLLAESWWAEVFKAPTFRELAGWSLKMLPILVASHFANRLDRQWNRLGKSKERKTGKVRLQDWPSLTLELGLFGVGALLSFLTMIVIALLLAVGVLPIPRLRLAIQALQRQLTGTAGDSLVLLESAMAGSAIVEQVSRDLEWLAKRCRSVAVVAHSQGAAVAYTALRLKGKSTFRLLLTFGSGLKKLIGLDYIRDTNARYLAWLILPGLLLSGFSTPTVIRAVYGTGWAGLWGLGVYLVLAVAAIFLSGSGRAEGLGKRLRKWLAFTLIAVATTVLAIQVLFPAMESAPVAIVAFMVGLIAVQVGSRPAFEKIKKDPRDLKPGGKWLDLYASADPVSNGPVLEPLDEDIVDSLEVFNRGATLSDHNTYWEGLDDFVARVACALGLVDGIDLAQGRPWDRERLEVARWRRRWRVRWLVAARLASMILGVGLLARFWERFWPQVSALPAPLRFVLEELEKPAALLQSLPLLGPLVPLPTEVPQISRILGALFAVAGVALLYHLLYRVWSWWTDFEIGRFFARGCLRLTPPQFTLFLVGLLAVIEAGALVSLGWTAGLTERFDRVTESPIVASFAICALVAAGPFLFTWYRRALNLAVWISGPMHAFLARSAILGLTVLFLLAGILFHWPDFYHDRFDILGLGVGMLAIMAVVIERQVVARRGNQIRRSIGRSIYAAPVALVWAHSLEPPERKEALIRRAGDLPAAIEARQRAAAVELEAASAEIDSKQRAADREWRTASDKIKRKLAADIAELRQEADDLVGALEEDVTALGAELSDPLQRMADDPVGSEAAADALGRIRAARR